MGRLTKHVFLLGHCCDTRKMQPRDLAVGHLEPVEKGQGVPRKMGGVGGAVS